MIQLNQNTTNLQSILDAVNALPEATSVSGTISITTNGTHDVAEYATANVNVQSDPVLLWTNASPASSFGAQTISLPTGYSGYIVEVAARWGGTMQYHNCGYIPLFSGNPKAVVAYFDNGRHYTYTRVINSAANGSIIFGGGNSGGGISYDDANNNAIPQRIWGVKFTL